MITTLSEVPLKEFLEARTPPEVVFDRLAADRWLVLSQAVAFESPGVNPLFTMIPDGDLVRVPLFRYRTRDKDLHTLAGFTLDLGVRACASLPVRPTRLHIALGVPVSHCADRDAYHVFVGFGFVVP